MNIAELRVLVVDDESQIRRLLRLGLESYKMSVDEAHSGSEALAQLKARTFDIVILDLGLPDMSGIEVLRRIRELYQVPVIILSVQNAEGEKVRALDLGADDYLTKPFGMAELQARMRVVLRRRQALSEPPETVLAFGDFELDLERHLLRKAGKETRLTSTEYSLLSLFARHAGRVLTHGQILREVWGPSHEQDTHYLRVYVGALRKKIEVDPNRPQFLLTEPGIGYRLAI